MIELTAKVARTGSSTYVTGELAECVIEFVNKDEKDLSSLAWASCQLNCYRKTTYTVRKSKDKTSEITEKMAKTSLDAATALNPGEIIYETKPKILFCELSLSPGERRKFFFAELIPREGPPTYRGHDIRYFYRFTIATQRIKSKVHTLHVPVRVFPLPILHRLEDALFTEETNDELKPTNPFLEKEEPIELELSWEQINNITARRSPKYYRITNNRGFIAKFCLFKSAYKLGENIVGSLDFQEQTIRCVQFLVKLQCEEIDLHNIKQDETTGGEKTDNTELNAAAAAGAAACGPSEIASVDSGCNSDNIPSSTTSTSGGIKMKSFDDLSGKISSFTRNHEVTYATLQTYINVPIPLDVTPTFRTDLVDLRWRLHFEFVTSTMTSFGEPDAESGILTLPREIPVETMHWDLPITLYTTNPLQVYAPTLPQTLLIK